MELMLFYPEYAEYLNDPKHHEFLEKLLGCSVTTYNVKEHRSNYDHDEVPDFFPSGEPMSDTCWCNIPDETDPTWPKLHIKHDNSNDFIAAGDAILKLTKEDIVHAS